MEALSENFSLTRALSPDIVHFLLPGWATAHKTPVESRALKRVPTRLTDLKALWLMLLRMPAYSLTMRRSNFEFLCITKACEEDEESVKECCPVVHLDGAADQDLDWGALTTDCTERKARHRHDPVRAASLPLFH